MPKKVILIVLVLVCIAVFTKGVSAKILRKDTIIQGITFPKGTRVDFYESGELKFATLAEPQEIQGIKCAKGTPVCFYKTGKIKYITLAEPHRIQGIRWRKGTSIYFYESGKINYVNLANSQKIQGVRHAKGSIVYLLEKGVSAYRLAEDTTIQGIKCAKRTWVSFFESGKIKSVTLAKDQEIQDITWPKGTEVFFYSSGKLKSITLAQPQEIQGVKYAKGSRVYLLESGKLRYPALAGPQKKERFVGRPVKFPFVVYREKGGGNHFCPVGKMGDTSAISVSYDSKENPYNGEYCIKVEYTGELSQGAGWAGVYWMASLGEISRPYDLRGATKLIFWVRGEEGGEVIEFGMGGIIPSDSTEIDTGPVTLTREWQKYEIDLQGHDLSHIEGGFVFAFAQKDNPNGCTFYLDDIMYEQK